ncbi:MAG TPA: response regulator [Thermodesulfovibrio thiophilus]|uniref:response regulator n=1 Tax=Thermodesulfovibrio thiophilus TaxID=340095 RepID=UPI00179D782D|nr:response regulator [Thermodesulfovibrio thiophilus]HHW20902.1 response regulator [Thermodesulfovibrio thiophilus]HOA82916.1 response regulator [Thermodesulfovibrio thiophilus]HQA04429.1 response regulator [Thermodesulfovibrio thiophilus]HQD35606.1 response regulator [Thermodesulfovibrio thiophilus]
MKILAVDDEKNILMLYKAELEDEGYEVITANSGREAIELFETHKPDIVTLDIMMPDMDGIQVLRQLKQKNPNIPVIMLTAYDYRDDFSIWASDAYVVKSSDLGPLKETIREISEKFGLK